MKIALFTLTLISIFSSQAIACPFDGNQTFAGSLVPSVGYQTQGGVSSGNYFSINVSCGNTYNFNLCNN